MSVQEMKIQIYQLIEHTDNELAVEQILQQAKSILANQTEPERDILDDLSPQQRAGLDRALEQANRGEGTPHSEVKKQIDQWLKQRLSGQIQHEQI